MTPAWLRNAIDRHLAMQSDERARLGEAICDAIPADAIVAAIAESAAAVLRQRGIADAAGDLARELARNAAQTVLFALALGEEG